MIHRIRWLRSSAREFPRVIASRWTIDSRVTSQFLNNLYTAMNQGQSARNLCESLRLEFPRNTLIHIIGLLSASLNEFHTIEDNPHVN